MNKPPPRTALALVRLAVCPGSNTNRDHRMGVPALLRTQRRLDET